MKKLCTFLLLLPTLAFAQGKTFLDFSNERAPIFPGCENAENILECYYIKVGGLVRDAVNTNYRASSADDDELLIELGIMTNPSGESSIQKVKAPNSEIEFILTEALKTCH